jgi:hypothetical protein
MIRKLLGWVFNCSMVILISNAAVCQIDLEILDPDSNVITGSTFTIYGLPSANYLYNGIRAENMGSNDLTMGIKRYENGVQAGTENFFGCMAPVDAGAFPLLNDMLGPHLVGTGNSYSMGVYHTPNGLAGVSCYMFVWFDDNNPVDYVLGKNSFYKKYQGVQEITPTVTSEVYPNPSNGQLNFAIAFENPVIEPRLTVYDEQGRLVWEKELLGRKERVVINDGELNSGMYMYQIVGDGRTHHAGRFVISD